MGEIKVGTKLVVKTITDIDLVFSDVRVGEVVTVYEILEPEFEGDSFLYKARNDEGSFIAIDSIDNEFLIYE